MEINEIEQLLSLRETLSNIEDLLIAIAIVVALGFALFFLLDFLSKIFD